MNDGFECHVQWRKWLVRNDGRERIQRLLFIVWGERKDRLDGLILTANINFQHFIYASVRGWVLLPAWSLHISFMYRITITIRCPLSPGRTHWFSFKGQVDSDFSELILAMWFFFASMQLACTTFHHIFTFTDINKWFEILCRAWKYIVALSESYRWRNWTFRLPLSEAFLRILYGFNEDKIVRADSKQMIILITNIQCPEKDFSSYRNWVLSLDVVLRVGEDEHYLLIIWK